MVCPTNETDAKITSRKELEALVRTELVRTVMAYNAGRHLSAQVASVVPALNRVINRIVVTQ